jgi:arginyl-tRNA synthetase
MIAVFSWSKAFYGTQKSINLSAYMEKVKNILLEPVKEYFTEHFGLVVPGEKILINETRPEFEGDYTLVVFPLAGMARTNPQQLAVSLGEYLKNELEAIENFQVVKGFLNLSFSVQFWKDILGDIFRTENLISKKGTNKIVLEYSSPNTNKPLHLGHIRNILLGWSVGQILRAVGHEVHYTQIINDRGIAICKSMLAWQKYGEQKTPESEKIKSDHFVGDYYVLFEQRFKQEYEAWQEGKIADKLYQEGATEGQDKAAFFKSFKNTYFNDYSALGREARDMLLKWEDHDPEVRQLWERMNQWVYDGFDETFERLGVSFDSTNYESNTYLLGKQLIDEGVKSGLFYQKEDGSIWVDLTDVGLDHKILLRSDGTSVYMTQDLGTAKKRYTDLKMDGMIYTVGNEQDYHFQALFEILKKLEEPYASDLHHLSYGMVDLPSGKMKSREGKVVDADDLIAEVKVEAVNNSAERGEISMLNAKEQDEIIERIALGALKYFILRVDPRKRMVFNPAESVDLQGQTGPYIQNAYVRIRSILRKAGAENNAFGSYTIIEKAERQLLRFILAFDDEVQQAAKKLDPSQIASYAYSLAKAYHRFYHDHSVLSAKSEAARAFRIQLSAVVAKVLKQSLNLLGIKMPDRM